MPEHPHIDKIYEIIQNAEREIQKECLSTGQPWINGFITQWNVVLGHLDLAELKGEITSEEIKILKENLSEVYELVDGGGGLREKYQANDISMPQSEKQHLLELLDIFAVAK